ncbi:YdiU family protein [Aquimarina sp. ERC-38]|uniref:protein adenylyltransferase SelO n=1 Tax=Aquimarina sp. ERC-38 TaxID=2949996 RepID=UPI0022480AE0|nr:YdiU family protein [Aquimarina sp. ERC-38]UZO79932.1 YdiU family protein [Aquimarina sp. ERC-38]
MQFPVNIIDSFQKELPADPNHENTRRQVFKACFSYVTPKKPSNPNLLHSSPDLLETLGLTDFSKTADFLKVFSGEKLIPGTHPYAMCYGGHQFGNWAGQLGDGRAINLTEIEHHHKSWVLQLKGAGETPYSRTADGLAVLRSSVREYLCSEAMYHLGVPTTRALSLVTTGDQVLRDVLYNGHPAYEKGAVVCRVSPSFLRFGNYELLAANQDIHTLQKLVDYTLIHHFSHLGEASVETYLQFFTEVADRTLEMVIEWQRVGFVHGVMNTDNMSILGLTIDYGPYGWLEGYDPNWTPNTTDSAHKRYKFGTQPQIALWNLVKLANALFPLIKDASLLETILEETYQRIEVSYSAMMRKKIGLTFQKDEDKKLIKELTDVLQESETDMTIFFRLLSGYQNETITKGVELVKAAFYRASEIEDDVKEKWTRWFISYAKRLQEEDINFEERKKVMNTVNPKYVLRNYMVQLAIDAANQEDTTVLNELFTLLQNPCEEQPEQEKWFAKRPEWARNRVGCSMLSCSS